jgi:2-phosphoglycerate kinase
VVIQIVLVVDDVDRHTAHFYVRDQETGGVRSLEKYGQHGRDPPGAGLPVQWPEAKVPVIDSRTLTTRSKR